MISQKAVGLNGPKYKSYSCSIVTVVMHIDSLRYGDGKRLRTTEMEMDPVSNVEVEVVKIFHAANVRKLKGPGGKCGQLQLSMFLYPGLKLIFRLHIFTGFKT